MPRFGRIGVSRSIVIVLLVGVLLTSGLLISSHLLDRRQSKASTMTTMQSEFIACLHQHGYRETTGISVERTSTLTAIPEPVFNDCKGIISKLPVLHPAPVTEAQKAKDRKYQLCMARHGFKITLQFNPNSVLIGPGPGVDVRTAAFKAANVACYPPDGLVSAGGSTTGHQ